MAEKEKESGVTTTQVAWRVDEDGLMRPLTVPVVTTEENLQRLLAKRAALEEQLDKELQGSRID